MISLIFAISKNNVIGYNNKLPWHIPRDMDYFTEKTIGKTVIMGRKTFEAIGKPLSRRKNIIITRNLEYIAKDCFICHSVEEAMLLTKNEDAFVIGGAEIYMQFLHHARYMFVTLIDKDVFGDTFLNNIDYSEWELISSRIGINDRNNKYNYKFVVYSKKLS